jgi:hypothetical protein
MEDTLDPDVTTGLPATSPLEREYEVEDVDPDDLADDEEIIVLEAHPPDVDDGWFA